MLKKIIPLAILAILMANCTKQLPQELTNKEKMNSLVISDPLIWNSLTDQSIELDTTLGMKSSNGMTKRQEYPANGYYFTFFEDLFPAQGDYDFNDVMLRTKLILDAKRDKIEGSLNTNLFNRGGTLPTRIGLMFYSIEGTNEYQRIDNQYIKVMDKHLEGDDPWSFEVPEVGTDIIIDFVIDTKKSKVKTIWVTYFIIVETNGVSQEVHTSGFPISSITNKFKIPQRDYLTYNNLPWGIVLESEEFFIPLETEVFIDVFPEFQEWAESEGKNKKEWHKNPNRNKIKG